MTDLSRLVLVSSLPLARQTQTLRATWLDAQPVGGVTDLATQGFGAEVRAARVEPPNGLGLFS